MCQVSTGCQANSYAAIKKAACELPVNLLYLSCNSHKSASSVLGDRKIGIFTVLGNVNSGLLPFCCCLGPSGDMGGGSVSVLSEWPPNTGCGVCPASC